MHLRRKLFKLAVPMVIGYFVDPQLGAERRQRIVAKVQRMIGKAPQQGSSDSATAGWTSSTVVSETVSERLVVADGNGRVVGDSAVETASGRS